MIQKLLNNFKLRAVMLVALMCAAFAGQAWADDEYEAVATFSSASVVTASGYASTYATSDWTLTFGGNNASMGTNKNSAGSCRISQNYGTSASTSNIATAAVSKNKLDNVSQITFTHTAGNGNSGKIYFAYSTDNSTWNAITLTSGTQGANTPAANATMTVSFAEISSAYYAVILDKGNATAANFRFDNVTINFNKKKAVTPAYTITPSSNDEDMGTVSLTGTTITASPKSGYRVKAGTDGYTVTSGTATVTNNGDNTFSVSPNTDCTVQINFEAIPTYAVTIETPTGGTLVVKNGDDVVASGDAFPAGTVLTVTATPADGYNFTRWTAVDASTHNYTVATTYTMTEHVVTLSATFTAKVYHDAYFLLSGGAQYAQVKTEEGQAIEFPADPAAVEGREFVGWVAATIDGTTDSKPTFVTSADMGNADVTYYACYAYRTPGSSATKTDELTLTTTGVSGTSYSAFSSKSASNTGHSDAVYAGQCAGGNDAIQLNASTNTSKRGIITTTSGGTAAKVTVSWNSNTATDRSLKVYGSNTAYSSVSDFNTSMGTELGSITKGTSTELSISGNYKYLGFYATSAIYIDQIDIDWTVGTPDTFSGYCTTVPADVRTAVNITAFTAANTTLVIGGTTTTSVTNDQDGWTESYLYTSDNTSVATVADDGTITAVAKGTANITVSLNIPTSGGSYKKGDIINKSIEITVTKPFHTVTFMANGSQVSSTSVEEDEDIEVPSDPAAVGNFSFQGWNTSAIDGVSSSAPSYATITTMGDADVTYYAVYAVDGPKNVTATFDASNISATPATANSLEWKHTATGILLKLSAGQRYTSGTPNTFSVTKGSANYFRITTPTGGKIKKIVTEVSGTDYVINSVTAGSLSTNGTTQTITFTSDASTVDCVPTDNYQIRAKTIVVDAIINSSDNYCTTLPAYNVTVGATGYTTYVAANNVSFPSGASAYIVTETDESSVTLEEVLAVPAGTAVVVKGDAGTYDLDVEVSGDCDDVSSNLLLASDGSVTGGDGIYALGVGKSGDNEGKVGFYLVDSSVTIPAGKAYLDLSGTPVKEFLTFDFDLPTGIGTVQGEGLTVHGSEIYNLAGQKMSRLQKGLNIMNGKKVLVK
ncbi:MAG: Ig-like domain-containing protein [Bacteroidaceae bacterium]|nr:Ig-like domain-containing protein [Bacteroidaceae bacterium]